MQFRPYYLGCLSHASYLLVSDGEAVVIDPQRDVDEYLRDAAAAGAEIRYIIETHLHADFVSGHRELADRTGAKIVFGEAADAAFPHHAAVDGEELRVGSMSLRILSTPGHTPESISVLVADPAEPHEPKRLFTGDTLFIGDVGRPDLVGSKGHSSAEMAGLLYDSLHQKILTIADDVEVWPAHGAGSACGRNLSNERSSTIGEQRRTNYALRAMTRDAFIALMTTDLPPAPRYFAHDAEMNRLGARPLSDIRVSALSPKDVRKLVLDGAEVLDVRSSAEFGSGHLPDAINVGLQGQYASWCGSLLRADAKYVVCAASEEASREAVTRLARVGLENVAGFLDGGVKAWFDAGLPLESVAQITVNDLAEELKSNARLRVIDVRRPAEYQSGHVPRATNVPLSEFEERLSEVPPGVPLAVICAGGYRSSSASSLLQRAGRGEVMNVVGGTAAWIAAGLPTER